MIHKISNKITNVLFSDSERYPIEVYTYGIEIILSSLLGCSSVIIISILFGNIFEGIIYITVLSLIRIFAGGYHADTYLKCNIITVTSFCISLMIHKFYVNRLIVYTPAIMIAFALFVFTILCFYAPVDNENKPVAENDKIKFKRISLIIAFFIFLISPVVYYLFGYYQVLIGVSAVLVESISIIVSLLTKER